MKTATAMISGSFAALLLSAAIPAHAQDFERLEIIEDLSESLANDLLDLSLAVRDDERSRAASFFADSLHAARFPGIPADLESAARWAQRHGWTTDVAEAPRDRPRGEFLKGWERFLDHFGEIEDARFKVKESGFDDSASTVADAEEPTATPGSAGWARIAFFVIGRDLAGHREWARGGARIKARRGDERWQITAFELLDLSSLVSETELFSEVAAPAGVDAHRQPYGSPGNTGFAWNGAAAGDVNGDGWMDVFTTGSDRNFLYVGAGDGTFRDASAEAGVDLFTSGVAPLLLDYDNDGDLDVFISAVGPQVLLENRLFPDKKLVFWDTSLETGVGAVQTVGFSATAADINADGRPDIYVASYNYYGRIVPDSWFRATNGRPNLMFVSQPDGSYREQARALGIDDGRWSYAASFADVNSDGELDLYVANDFGENALFVRNGERFIDEAKLRGVLDPGNGMGASFGDYDNDGDLDLHVTNMSSTAGNRILSRLFPGASAGDNVLMKLAAGNNLYLNGGDGHYTDITSDVGAFSAGWAWGGGFFDFDNNGWEDLYTPNGFISGRSMKDT